MRTYNGNKYNHLQILILFPFYPLPKPIAAENRPPNIKIEEVVRSERAADPWNWAPAKRQDRRPPARTEELLRPVAGSGSRTVQRPKKCTAPNVTTELSSMFHCS